MHKIIWDFEIQTDHLYLDQTTRPSDSQQNLRTCWMADFGVLADLRVKLKESKKKDK